MARALLEFSRAWVGLGFGFGFGLGLGLANPNPNPNQACIAIFCAMLGFLSPANRGGAQPQPEP